MRKSESTKSLRRGWTTGACATAATKAAYQALLTGEFPDPVSITLPKGQQPAFVLAKTELSKDCALAGIIKDAGDDPDVAHQALILSRVRRTNKDTGVIFKTGVGVGIVTKPGLSLAVGEPAINPVPRQMMQAVISDLAALYQDSGDVEIEISIPNGEELAQKTWNPRLGIVGGLSILGTTGIVIPYSCSAWIHSIHRGIDVARATGLKHVAGCTGSTSEKEVQKLYNLPDEAMLDMGDFVGGLLKYLRRHPVEKLTIGGGFAKLCKLADGYLDLHSGRSQVDFDRLAKRVTELGATEALSERVKNANTANEVLSICNKIPLADHIADEARNTAIETLHGETEVEVLVFNHAGDLVGHNA